MGLADPESETEPPAAAPGVLRLVGRVRKARGRPQHGRVNMLRTRAEMNRINGIVKELVRDAVGSSGC